ncbi:hypothetical protein [Bradyrhizobium sp. STM 3843]|uniref:hypothetical protein n=1 Tax=Bradyrhizobium sp. STM 3843 TaxID=551947 RepID=UPI001112AB7D|nr:hypothetical protein [Bradyrhizobium sp. STM 3843]
MTMQFALPHLSEWLGWIYLIGIAILFALLIRAAIGRRWQDSAIFAVIWCVVLFPLYAPITASWMRVEAFRAHVSPIASYLSQCKLIDFVAGNAKQKLGRCENLGTGGEEVLEIFYDTTGLIVAPPAQRTPEWRAAMGHFSPTAVHLEGEGRARRLFGDFYEIALFPHDYDGSNDDF